MIENDKGFQNLYKKWCVPIDPSTPKKGTCDTVFKASFYDKNQNFEDYSLFLFLYFKVHVLF